MENAKFLNFKCYNYYCCFKTFLTLHIDHFTLLGDQTITIENKTRYKEMNIIFMTVQY